MAMQLFEEIRKGSFFSDLRALKSEELADRLRWASLLTTDRLWSWIRQDVGAERALAAPRCEDAWYSALAVLLERHLLNLDTRFNPQPLFEFWDWVTTASKCNGTIAKIWRRNENTIRESCGAGSLSLDDIIIQERNFAGLLSRAENALTKAPSKLKWAADTVARLAARRAVGDVGQIPRESFARVVFAWEGELPAELRPAILIDLELGMQGCVEPYIEPGIVFDESFHKTVRHVSDELLGRRRFHRLKYHSPPGTDLAAGSLTGESGGLAILLAQILANRPTGHWQKHWFAMPPWVVVTATLDPKAKGRACPVGAVEAKIKLLREEGVRVVVVANATPQLTAVSKALESYHQQHGLAVIPAERSPQQTAERLISEGCAWQADIEKPQVVTRRSFVGATVIAGLGVAAGGFCFPAQRPKTVAMQRHKRSEMHDAAKAIRDEFNRNPKQGAEDYLTNVLKAEVVESPPLQTSFQGLEILKKSVHFDSVDWEEVLSIEALKQTPIEPTYSTTVWELRKPDLKSAPSHIVLESNTSGFGVFPILIGDLKPEIRYRKNKKMQESREAGNLTLTTYRIYDISGVGNQCEPFYLEDFVVYFNGTQDQTCRGAAHDWWGTRLPPSTCSADLTVEFPESRKSSFVKHVVRQETQLGQLVPVREIKEGDALWSPADLSDGSYTDGLTSAWNIPCNPINGDKFRWIYSIQWKWK